MEIGAIGASAGLYSTLLARPDRTAGEEQLTPEQQQQVQKLKATDQKVREHEAAHMAAGAGLVSGANYQFTRGPDGRQYAVSGEVKIDVSPASTPQQTIDKARRIQAAALAPADPSPQDRSVAAQAAQMAAQAQLELSRQQNETNAAAGTGAQEASASPALAAYADQQPEPAPTFSLYA